MLNQKYIFSAFNILIYAQNYILKMASGTEDFILESNRENLYQLYEYAIELEPKPEREELTFSQQQLVNRARQFVTMKMKRRQNLREQKQEVKKIIKAKRSMGDMLEDTQKEILEVIQKDIASKQESQEESKEMIKPKSPTKVDKSPTLKASSKPEEVSAEAIKIVESLLSKPAAPQTKKESTKPKKTS